MSSKYVDLTTLKSVPNKYGFRGQALFSLVNVSKSVKVVSRHKNSQETWVKLFEQGQEKQLEKYNTRPSKGTTVEVTGFLYNLNIQNKSKDILHTLQSIKTFLEHISLVHINVSLSLRDDSKNEIVFKIHKNRDVPQTLSTLYNIETSKLQELLVEKNEYKVTAYISKSDYEAGKHLIFLNERFIVKSSKLHKIVNSNLSKSLKQRCVQKSKIKQKVTEESFVQKNIPDYCIFLKCPHADYELSNSPKQSVLEFKDWDQISKLFSKLIKFFNGELTLKRVNNVEEETNRQETSSTREQVKKIMERILASNTKKTGSMYLRNGIKGKQVKRKSKKTSRKATKDVTENQPIEKLGCDLNNSNHIDDPNNNSNVDQEKYSKVNVTKTNLRSSGKKKYNKHSKKITDENNYDVQKIGKLQTYIDKTTIKNKSRHKRNLLLKRKKVTHSVKKRCDELHKNTMLMLHEMHKNIMNKSYKNSNIAQKHINVTVHKSVQEIIIKNKPKHIKSDHINVKSKQIQSNYDLLQTILKSQSDSKLVQERNVLHEKYANKSNEIATYVHHNDPERNPRVLEVPKTGVHIAKPRQSVHQHTGPIITYESHNYYTRESIHTETNTSYHSHAQIRNEKRTFITKQSLDNFIVPNDGPKRHNFKTKHLKSGIPTPIHTHVKNLFKQTSKLFNLKKKILGATCESSYTIEVTESNRFRSNDRAVMSNLSQNVRTNGEEIRSQSMKYNSAANDNDVIAIDSSNVELPNVDNNGYSICDEGFCNLDFHGTYTIERTDQIISNSESQDQNTKTDTNETVGNNKNFIFVSKSQEREEYYEPINPINVCETILGSDEMIGREFETSFGNQLNLPKNNDAQDESMFYNLHRKDYEDIQDIHVEHNHDDNCQNITKRSNNFDLSKNKTTVNKTIDLEGPAITNEVNCSNNINLVQEVVIHKENQSNVGDFNLINRPGFIPKGLSPIFQNCVTRKTACEYNLSRDYYEKELYNNFADKVRNNAEVFEPKVQGINEDTTKAIDKVNIKLVKDKAALKFDGQSLHDAKIYGQIDDKFIAATIREKENDILDYLVLFDQHAVHERIRLENNLEDYFKENQWKAMPIEAVVLKLPKDELLYLHNFRDKFKQLGLYWNIVNNDEISISAIPEAILGKNPRQVEKVIKAVRSLITEEINILKIQGGCVSLYPKSIMDLVFSEACRYAIKFGDKLSKAECMELIRNLSSCKTPFQCAHGRPVMAVVMEIKPKCEDYKINIKKILEWQRNNQFKK